jgi:hypothetical protein
MFIKNQQFNDDDTLFEVLYDFEIGEPSGYMQGIVDALTKAMNEDAELTAHLRTLEEEDALELFDDIRREQIVGFLKKNFSGFVVDSACFYGLSNAEKSLLYSM